MVSDCTDVAFNEIRASILKELGDDWDKAIIEPLVPAKEFSLINGAFLVRLLSELYSPEETIFLVVLNPLTTISEYKARIYGETLNGFRFVGANTGTLNWLIEDFGLKSLYELNAPGLTGNEFIPFGGKFVHAPLVAKIVKGITFESLGTKRNKEFLSKLKIEDGCVVSIDNFGIVKIKGKIEIDEGKKYDIYVNGKRKFSATATYSMKDLADGSIVIYPGSSLNKMPEICKVRELDSAKSLNLNIGDIITWKNQK